MSEQQGWVDQLGYRHWVDGNTVHIEGPAHSWVIGPVVTNLQATIAQQQARIEFLSAKIDAYEKAEALRQQPSA